MKVSVTRLCTVLRPWSPSWSRFICRGASLLPTQSCTFVTRAALPKLFPWPGHARYEAFSMGVIRTEKRKDDHETGPANDAEDFPFELKRMTMRTCEDLYAEMFIEQRLKVPPTGIDIDVAYVDTGYPDPPAPGEKRTRRQFSTVLCIHGAGGSHKDLAGIIVALADRGARVISPVFPGAGPTPMDKKEVYSHSVLENASFLLDFLRALKIARIDVMVAFSAGCYPAVALACNTAFPIRSLALLQVPGHRPYKAVRPFWLLRRTIRLMRRRWIRRLLAPVWYLKSKLSGSLQSDIEHAYFMGQVAVGVDFDTYTRTSAELPFSRLPMLLTFSLDDQFVDQKISFEYANIIGLPAERLTRYDGQGNLVRRGAPRQDPDFFLKGVIFESGGHFAQKKEPTASLMEEAVCELFQHVKRSNERRWQEAVRQDPSQSKSLSTA